jgi:hypothetical protein
VGSFELGRPAGHLFHVVPDGTAHGAAAAGPNGLFILSSGVTLRIAGHVCAGDVARVALCGGVCFDGGGTSRPTRRGLFAMPVKRR